MEFGLSVGFNSFFSLLNQPIAIGVLHLGSSIFVHLHPWLAPLRIIGIGIVYVFIKMSATFIKIFGISHTNCCIDILWQMVLLK